MFDFYPRVIGNDVIVAVQAFFDRRYTRVVGVPHVRVAVLTLNLFDPAVNVVAERNGLFRAEVCLGPAVENIKKAPVKTTTRSTRTMDIKLLRKVRFPFFKAR